MRFFNRSVVVLGFLIYGLNMGAGSASAQKMDGRIVIRAEDIATMKAVRMEDVLNQVPGLKAGEKSVSIHGSHKVKVLVDGRPINDPTSSHSGIKWDMVSLENVERIEILRGKGGMQYGDNASGGVILLTTKQIHHLSGNVKVDAGNDQARGYSTNFHLTKGSLGAAFSVAHDRSDGYNINNDEEKWLTGVKFIFSPKDTTQFTLSADYLKEEKGRSGTPVYPTPSSRIDSRLSSYSLSGKIDSIAIKTYLNDGRKHNTDKSKGLDKTLRVKDTGVDITTSCSIDPLGELNYGTALKWGQAQGTTLQTQEEAALSIFGVQSIKIPNVPLSFTAGLRGNYYSEFGNSFNPEIKAFWQKEHWNLTLAYSRAENTPSFHQRWNETSSMRPNPDLKMETTDNYNLSVFTQLGPSLSGGVSLFYNEITDRITYVRQEDGTSRYENFGKVTYKGGDVSIRWKLTNPLTFKMAYTYLRARDEKNGYWLTAKARHKANAELYYTPLKSLSLVAGVDVSSKIYTRSDNSKSVPGYAIARVRGEYRFKRLSVYGEIRNISDKTYYYAGGILAPPRTWLLGVNWTF